MASALVTCHLGWVQGSVAQLLGNVPAVVAQMGPLSSVNPATTSPVSSEAAKTYPVGEEVKTTSAEYSKLVIAGEVGSAIVPEAVKALETTFGQMFCISASSGSLIHATVGSFGGVGRQVKRDGFAA